MNKELTLEVCGESLKLLLQSGFFDVEAATTPIHNHKNTEIQVVAAGWVKVRVGNGELSLEGDDMLIVPRDTFHALSEKKEGTRRIAFQVSKPYAELSKIKLPRGLASSVVSEVEQYCKSGKTKRLCTYLALLCAELFGEYEPPLLKSTDRAFLIDEYFAKSYNDPEASLDAIASMIGVSKKQAEREIVKITGNNFRTELSLRRIRAAKLLMEKGYVNLSDVAEEVGYKSYSGFWKAFGKHKNAE